MVNHHREQVLLVLPTNRDERSAIRTHSIVKTETQSADRDETTVVSIYMNTGLFSRTGCGHVLQETTGRTEERGARLSVMR